MTAVGLICKDDAKSVRLFFLNCFTLKQWVKVCSKDDTSLFRISDGYSSPPIVMWVVNDAPGG